jgi:hypothetical protein
MVEDPIEKDKCIICGKDTDRIMEQFSQLNQDNIPLCGGCEATSPKIKILKAVEEYMGKRDGEDISRTLALIMKEKGYEHYLGNNYQGEEGRHFIKDGRIVTIIVNHSPDEEDIEDIRGE